MAVEKIPAPKTTVDSLIRLCNIEKRTPDLFYRKGSQTWSDILCKAVSKSIQSNQGVTTGRQERPFNFRAALAFLNSNENHATCIGTKVMATVGLGYKYDMAQADTGLGEGAVEESDSIVSATALHKALQDIAADPLSSAPAPSAVRPSSDRLMSKVDIALDPLCSHSWADVLSSAGEDYEQLGNGFIEVVREGPNGKIIGAHHLQAPSVHIHVENLLYDFHYEIDSPDSGITRRFAKFGDTASFQARYKYEGTGRSVPNAPDNAPVSEVIHLRMPTSQNRWYGMPRWLAAVPSIELAQCLVQYKFDFFLNRGVPEFLLFLLTQSKLPEADWKSIETSLRANIGLGNSHKSMALNITDPEAQVILHKLNTDSKSEENFPQTKEVLATAIVTAHRVPPLLAGILIPGKLGSTNELPNALMAFQALVVGPNQRIIQQTFGKTLGSKEAGLGLTLTDFESYTVLDEIDVGQASTIGQMRQPLPEAQAEGRDLSAGVKS